MKKLAKPIELKGRVIRFDIKVHLKKKKTATKTWKNVGKKMRGGDIDTDGILTSNDFLINKVNITSEQQPFVHNSSYNYGGFQRPIFHHEIKDYNRIRLCRWKRKADMFQEPFIFFGKKVYGTLIEGESNKYSSEPIVYYEYVAFNEGRFQKTAKFKKFFSGNTYSFPDVNISEIPKDALIQLRDFILKQRTERNFPTFCNTIYSAVEAV